MAVKDGELRREMFYLRLYSKRCEAITQRNTRCKFTSVGHITEFLGHGLAHHEVCRTHFFSRVRGWWT